MDITIDKAIEELKDLSHQPWMASFSSFLAAIKLGEEALKRLKEHREIQIDFTESLLPGETKD